MAKNSNLKTLLENVKTVLFDVDGTLVDSNELHAEAWVKALAKTGHAITKNEILPWIGKGGDKILADLIGLDQDGPESKAIGELRATLFKEQYVGRVEAFPRARELVEHLKKQGLHVAIATSARADELASILKVAGLQGIFPDATTSSDAKNSKPDPDIIQAALKLTRTSPLEAVMIGDTPYDLEAAKAAGVRAIAVRTGGWPDAALKEAVLIFDDLDELLSVLTL